MNEEVLSSILKKPEKINYIMSKKKAYIIIATILILLFFTITLLTITEGILKMGEYVNYAAEYTDTNNTGDSLAWVLGMIFIGVIYTFMGSCIISYIVKYIKNIDSRIKKTIRNLPLFTILFAIPAMLLAGYIARSFNLIG